MIASNFICTYIKTPNEHMIYVIEMTNCHWYSFYNFRCIFNVQPFKCYVMVFLAGNVIHPPSRNANSVHLRNINMR